MAKKGGFRQKGIHVLAWVDLAVAIAGGAALSLTFVGAGIAWVLAKPPVWVPIVALVIGFAGAALDCICDGVPNRLAIWMGLLLPSIARAVPQRLGTEVSGWSQAVMDAINEAMAAWTGSIPMIALAVLFTALALLIARRVVVKGGGR
jgi:hypothetical protein